MIDYLIIGSGLAGISFSEMALQNNKSIIVLDNDSQNSSKIAGGLYNPVMLKRFSEVSQAQEHLLIMNDFFLALKAKLSIQFDYKLPILRKFFSIEEQNNWFAASDKPNLAPFLSNAVVNKKYTGIDSPFGYGEVPEKGYVDTVVFLDPYQHYLKSLNLFYEKIFAFYCTVYKFGYSFCPAKACLYSV